MNKLLLLLLLQSISCITLKAQDEVLEPTSIPQPEPSPQPQPQPLPEPDGKTFIWNKK